MNAARRMLHRLAAKLGKSVAEVEAMPGQELLDWITYESPNSAAPASLKEFLR